MSQHGKRDGNQSGGINIDNGDVVIGRDAVGRDKIESHQYYGETSLSGWEEFYAGGCLARTLMIIGTMILLAGILTFMGTVLLGFTGSSFEAVNALVPYTAAGFGTALVGGLILTVGRAMARHRAYRQRKNSGRR